MNLIQATQRAAAIVCAILLLASVLGGRQPQERPAENGKLVLPFGAASILDEIYSFDLGAGIADAKRMQDQRPDDPLGYLLEAEARWWKIWCLAAEYKYGMTFAQHRQKLAADERYLELSATALSIAEAHLKKQESADMHLYAGMAQASLARLYGLRGESRATARAGVKAREHFLRALQMDPTLADADFGLGLYNYYADTLSGFIKFLGFFMGIPGGNKTQGVLQLQHAISEGVFTSPAARFYLALDLHRYDQRYEEALTTIGPLAAKYPSNPLFQMVRADLYGKLGRKEQAISGYLAADSVAISDEECRIRVRQLIRQSLVAQGVDPRPGT